MKMKIDYFDNEVKFDNQIINVIEIENRKYFYRYVNDLNDIYNNGFCDDINFYEETVEKNMNGKIKIVIDFFNFQFDSKKYVNDISKYVNENIDEESVGNLSKLYNKIIKIYSKILNEVELPLSIEKEIDIESITKFVKISIDTRNELLDNLLLLIDLEKVLKTNNLLFFINLKQYLTNNELIELYKYAIYNEVNIILVDSQTYGCTLKYEKKLIIDENLDEFVL